MSRLRKAGVATGATAIGMLAIATVGPFEGLRTTAYRDIVGIPTVCYGETKGVKMGDRHSKDECDAKLLARLDEFANHVEACVKRPMPAKVEVAFVSLAYNVGEGAFCKSSVLRLYNAGEGRAACDALMRFNRAGGHEVAGLTKRRKAERMLCLEGLAEKPS